MVDFDEPATVDPTRIFCGFVDEFMGQANEGENFPTVCRRNPQVEGVDAMKGLEAVTECGQLGAREGGCRDVRRHGDSLQRTARANVVGEVMKASVNKVTTDQQKFNIRPLPHRA
jgi:hypothetical protein